MGIKTHIDWKKTWQCYTKVPSMVSGSILLLCWWQVEQADLIGWFKDLLQLFVVSNHRFACQTHPGVILGGEDPLIRDHTWTQGRNENHQSVVHFQFLQYISL